MDPNALLAEFRELMEEFSTPDNMSREELAAGLERLTTLTSALDEWLSKGGFLPADWER